jgi:hypothetical protein
MKLLKCLNVVILAIVIASLVVTPAMAAPKIKEPIPEEGEIIAVTTVEVTGSTVYRNDAGEEFTLPYSSSEAYEGSIGEVPVKTSSVVDGVYQASSGSGGYVQYAGTRQPSVTTTYYLTTNTNPPVKLTGYKSRWYYEFRAGKVTIFQNLASSYIKYGLFSFVFYHAGETVGAPQFRTYNNFSNGEVYCWRRGDIEFRITKFGVLYQMQPLHEIWARGNGTYVWRASS